MKKVLLSVLLVCLILLGAPKLCEAAQSVTVTLPTFDVHLNGTNVDNQYREYPLIVYKEITYFPLTYYDCRFLGLGTQWSMSDGLAVDKEDITCGYRDYEANAKNKSTYTASIPTFNIKINGKLIDNSKEKYPLLIFRDVTYFPMTWRFCVDEFGWQYSFTMDKGLNISSSNTNVTRVLDGGLINFGSNGAILPLKDKCIYIGDGKVYSIDYKTQKQTSVYELPVDYISDNYVNAYFTRKTDGNTYLSYHIGGGFMGRFVDLLINEDGSISKEEEVGNMTYNFGDTTITLSTFSASLSDNLFIKIGDSTFTNLGSSEYLYGWAGKYSNRTINDTMYLIDNYLYILGIKSNDDNAESKVVRIDINTNETVEITDSTVKNFRIEGNSLYAIDADHITRIDLSTNESETIDISGAGSYCILNDKIFILDTKSGIIIYGQDEHVPDTYSPNMIFREENYVVATYDETADNKYRTIVMNENGDIVFKTSDVMSTLSIEGDIITYVERHSGSIYTSKLKCN